MHKLHEYYIESVLLRNLCVYINVYACGMPHEYMTNSINYSLSSSRTEVESL